MNRRKHSVTTIILLVAITLAILGVTQTSRADTLCVHPTGGSGCYTTIQAAVDAALPGDEIHVATGTYSTINDYGGLAQVVYVNKTVTILGGYASDFSTRDPNTYPTTVDAQRDGHGFYVTGYIAPIIDGLRITGGNALGLGGGVYGENSSGGIYVINASATINNCRILDNIASYAATSYTGRGGGVYLTNSDATLSGNVIQNNFVTTGNWGYGGAYGLIPILATQRPDNTTVKGFLKANLGTRISLPVPTHHDSGVILGQPGAEKLDKRKGRILTVWEGEIVEAQACDDDEIQLVLTAVNELEGNFHIRELAELTGISRRQIENLAPRWQKLGLLTPSSYEGTKKIPRQITPRLMSLAGV